MNRRNTDIKRHIADIDFHAHILPRCDHGSRGLPVSLQQLELARRAGIDVLCATPHFYPNKELVESFLERRAASYALLKEHMSGDEPKILLGAEVLICEGIEKLDNIKSLCIGESNSLLLEMPFYKWSEELFDTVERLTELDDISVVIAHADRYDVADIERLLDYGVDLQINVDNLSKRFKNCQLLKWIREGCVIALGSDIHGVDTGYKYWGKCRKIIGEYVWSSIMEATLENIK